MTGWRTIFPSERLWGNARFLRLGEALQGFVHRLYSRADRWGQGPAHPEALRSVLLLGRDAALDLERVATSTPFTDDGFVHVFEVDGEEYWHLAHYEDDAFADQKRKRGRSNYPLCPCFAAQDKGQAGPAGGLPSVASGPGPSDAPAPAHARMRAWVAPSVDDAHEAQNKGQAGPAARADQIQPSGSGDERTRDARARVLDWPALNPTPPGAWPSPELEAIGRAWISALHELGLAMHGHATVTPAAVAAIAQRHPGSFDAACREAIAKGATWGGWRARRPMEWLEKEAEIQARKAAAPKAGSGRAAKPQIKHHDRVDDEAPVTDLAEQQRLLDEETERRMTDAR